MRAGTYAELEGRVYRCWFAPGNPRVALRVPASETPPPGFERSPRGDWKRMVPRAELDRLFVVRTEGTWAGHQVRVESVEGEHAEVSSRSYPPPDRPEVVPDRGSWEARVPVAEIHDVVEAVHDVPL